MKGSTEVVSIVVHCSKCGWSGSNPKAIYKPDPLCPDEVIPEMGCPICNSDQYILIIDFHDWRGW
jgi:hypothetical protein